MKSKLFFSLLAVTLAVAVGLVLPYDDDGLIGSPVAASSRGTVSTPVADNPSAPPLTAQDTSTTGTSQETIPTENPEAELGALERQEAERMRWQASLTQHQERPGNLQQFLQHWLDHCQQDCLHQLRNLLADYPDSAFVAQVLALASEYARYLEEQSTLVQSIDRSPQERYQRIDELRVGIFGEDGTNLLFGQEKTWAERQFAYADLMTPAARSLAWEDRVSAYDQIVSAYDQDLWARPSTPIQRYREALDVALTPDMTAEQADNVRAAIQDRYLDEESRELVQQREQRESRQKDQLSLYWQAVETLNVEMDARKSVLTSEEWEAEKARRLEALRRQMFP